RNSRRDDDIDIESNKFSRDLCEALVLALCPANLDCHRAAVDPAEFAHSLHKHRDPGAPGRRGARAEEPDGWPLRRLLRAGQERPCSRRATNNAEKLPSPHDCPWLREHHPIGPQAVTPYYSITSSAIS